MNHRFLTAAPRRRSVCHRSPGAITLFIAIAMAVGAAACDDSTGQDDAGVTTAADTTGLADTGAPEVRQADIPPPQPAYWANLFINEVAASGDPTDWVELVNEGDEVVFLDGLTITDDTGDDADERTVLPAGLYIAPGGRLVLYLTSDAYPGFRLGREESFAIYEPDGDLIDSVGWAGGASPDDGSYGRIPDATGAFKTLIRPTPGNPNVDNPQGGVCGNGRVTVGEACDDANNDPDDGCEGCQKAPGWLCNGQPSVCTTRCGDAVAAGEEECDDGNGYAGDGCSGCRIERAGLPLAINEVMARPIVGGDWVEITNVGTESITLDGWWLTDELTDLHRYLFPAGTTLGPGDYLVIEGNVTPGFGFGFGGTDEAWLFAPDGRVVDFLRWTGDDVPEGRTFGRLPDGTGDPTTLSMPSHGAPNE